MIECEPIKGKVVSKKQENNLIHLEIDVFDKETEAIKRELGENDFFHASGSNKDEILSELEIGQEVVLSPDNTGNDSFSMLGARWTIKPTEEDD